VNALFPHRLAEAAQAASCHVLQIATDCVYSGAKGNYQEPDPHDALDVYGKSKSLGEVKSEYMHHIRCSIIGPEPYTKVSLLEWFRGQAKSATVKGFTNHEWNGVTTLEFAKVCHGIIKSRMDVPGLHHLVPGSRITKGDLLECFAAAFNREDIRIEKAPAASVIDRTLTTRDEALNRKLWQSAGYVQPPSIPEMVDNLAKFVQPAVLT
jgi:dTDP-4-dehydrorhamnose reductase